MPIISNITSIIIMLQVYGLGLSGLTQREVNTMEHMMAEHISQPGTCNINEDQDKINVK